MGQHHLRGGNDTRSSKATLKARSTVSHGGKGYVPRDHPAWGLTRGTIGDAAVDVDGRLRVIAETAFWSWEHIPAQTCQDCVHWEQSRCTLGIPEAKSIGVKNARLCTTFNPGEQ
jgi:hypothetical protein